MKSYNVKFDVGDMVEFDKKDNPYDAKYNPWKVVGIYIGFNNIISYRLSSEIQSANTTAFEDHLLPISLMSNCNCGGCGPRAKGTCL